MINISSGKVKSKADSQPVPYADKLQRLNSKIKVWHAVSAVR